MRCDAKQLLSRFEEFKRRKKVCDSTNIYVRVMYKGRMYNLCRQCWIKISASDISW